MTHLLYACGICSLCFALISFFCAGTANAGFNIVLTGQLNIGWCVGSYYVIKNSKTPIAVSILSYLY